jgi:hypothetical protein
MSLSELFRVFGFVRVKEKLRDLRHIEGTFLTPDLFLIPAGKIPKVSAALSPTNRYEHPPPKRPMR